MRLYALALLLLGCSNGSAVDGGTDAPPESSSSEGGGNCGISLCVPYGASSPECPSCAPTNNAACTPADASCGYSNGCSGGALNTAMCACVVPDGGDADAGGVWSCHYGA